MGITVDIADLIHRGGMFEIDAKDAKDAYSQIVRQMKLPADISPEIVYKSLCEREDVLSTAVGNGIAIPHTRTPVLKEGDGERICVVYLKKPIDMKAPDGAPVFAMFVLLSEDTQKHLSVLSSLAALFANVKFRHALESKSDEQKLAAIIRELA